MTDINETHVEIAVRRGEAPGAAARFAGVNPKRFSLFDGLRAFQDDRTGVVRSIRSLDIGFFSCGCARDDDDMMDAVVSQSANESMSK